MHSERGGVDCSRLKMQAKSAEERPLCLSRASLSTVQACGRYVATFQAGGVNRKERVKLRKNVQLGFRQENERDLKFELGETGRLIRIW